MAIFGAIYSFLTGCVSSPPPKPTQPGVSHALQYPVMLLGTREIRTHDDERHLITTTVASGGTYHTACTLIDVTGMEYAVQAATPFGQKSAWLDMGTSSYQLYLQLKPKAKVDLATAKRRVLAELNKSAGDDEIDTAKFQAAASFTELFAATRYPWRRQ